MPLCELLGVTGMFDVANELLAQLSGSAAIVGIVAFLFWKADNLISKSGKDLLEKLVKESIKDPERSELRQVLITFLKQYFSPTLPAHTFIANVALFTIASMAILLVIYVSRTNGFFEQLESEPYALRLFLTQFFLNGFIVTYFVNHISFFVYSILIERIDLSAPNWNSTIIVSDVLAKISLFILASMASYVSFSVLAGSFGGNPVVAAKATVPTIAQGLRFENLTGVYLYSVAISSFPIFLISLINLLVANHSLRSFVSRFFFWLPFEGRPMRSVAVVLGIFAVVFYQVSSAAVAFM